MHQKRYQQSGRKYLQIGGILDKRQYSELISRIYKELSQLNYKKDKQPKIWKMGKGFEFIQRRYQVANEYIKKMLNSINH